VEAIHERARSMTLRIVVWLLPLFLGYAVEAMSAEQSTELRRMPFQWAVALHSAVAEFEKIKVADRSCYEVSIHPEGDHLSIYFSPVDSSKPPGVRGSGSRCGVEVNYEVSLSGKVLKTTFIR